MTNFRASIAGCALALASPSIAQEAAPPPEIDPVEAAKDTPIIVTATREEDQIKSGTASRIAKKPRFTNQNIRSESGIAGLTPGSGMTPLAGENRTHRKRIVTCVGAMSDGAELGERAACLIAQGQMDAADGEVGLAADVYRYVASSSHFTTVENRAGGNLLYALAEEQGDDALREEALIRMLDAEVLPSGDAQRARRTLVSMALKRQDTALAIERLEDVVEADPKDARSLANLAVLMRGAGMEGAQARMEQAIAARSAKGLVAPKTWRDFVNGERGSS